MSRNLRRARVPKDTKQTFRLGWRAGLFSALVLMTMVTTAAGLYQVRESYRITRMGLELDRARLAQGDLLEEARRLRLRIEAHKHPAEVVRRAASLNMKPARAVDEFHVPTGAEDPAPVRELEEGAP